MRSSVDVLILSRSFGAQGVGLTIAKTAERAACLDLRHVKAAIRRWTGADLGGGGGVEGAAAPPFVWVWDFLGQCPRMVHELLRT